VIFAAAVFPELRAADPALGARVVLQRSPSRVENVEVDDPGVLRDVDLPEDFERLYGAPPA
jgi:molybdenum cofactor cytidylyltransferase